jgi:hypothetical protein
MVICRDFPLQKVRINRPSSHVAKFNPDGGHIFERNQVLFLFQGIFYWQWLFGFNACMDIL